LRLLEDVHDEVAIIERNPGPIAHAFYCERLHIQLLSDDPLNFFSHGAHLTVVVTAHDDEGIEGVNQPAQVKSDSVLT
jgi:hypothetical protein